MYSINREKSFTLVKAIVRKSKSRFIIDDDILKSCKNITEIKARGTLLRSKWYQSFLPSINPEQKILELLVPNHNLDHVLGRVSMKGELHHSGNGAILAFPCDETMFLNGEKKVDKKESDVQDDTKKIFREDLVSIVCIVQKDKANVIAKEAMMAGAPGPTISFGFGRGIRDRLGLVRICISPEKELLTVVVNKYEVDKIFDAMIKVGRLDIPGEGFIYTLPIEKGLINIPSIVPDTIHGVSISQIIKALDEIKGNSHWRGHSGFHDFSESDGIFQVQERTYLENLVRLTCVVVRGEGDALIRAAIQAGAPGASVVYGRQMGEEKMMGDTSIKLSNEREVIQLTLAREKLQVILDAILKEASEKSLKDIYFYTHIIPKAFTYLGPLK